MWGNTELVSKKNAAREGKIHAFKDKSWKQPYSSRKKILPEYKLVLVPATWRKSKNHLSWRGPYKDHLLWFPCNQQGHLQKNCSLLKLHFISKEAGFNCKAFQIKIVNSAMFQRCSEMFQRQRKRKVETDTQILLTENQISVGHWSLGIQTSKTH